MNAKRTMIVGVVVAGAFGLQTLAYAADASPARSAAAKRGQYLVTIAGCHDCHTPMKMGDKGPEPDMSRMLSGHPEQMEVPAAPALPPGPWQVVTAPLTAWAGPWGTSFTANLTPDKETGLGNWTEQNFVETIRSGRHLGRGRAILPPMPWQIYSQMTDSDLKAVFAYLRTITPIKNRVPAPRPPPEAPTASSK